MNKASFRTRFAAIALALGAFGAGGVAMSTGASALDNPPAADGKAGCELNGVTWPHRAVKEINGYTYECQNGQWVRLNLYNASQGSGSGVHRGAPVHQLPRSR
jgi:hypothetical protein